jgi:hypothetical protein
VVEMTKINLDVFYGKLKGEGLSLRDLLWPLSDLTPRERAVFVEYHYWKTHMRIIAKSHRISLGRAYEILYRSEEKVAVARAQAKAKGHIYLNTEV